MHRPIDRAPATLLALAVLTLATVGCGASRQASGPSLAGGRAADGGTVTTGAVRPRISLALSAGDSLGNSMLTGSQERERRSTAQAETPLLDH